MTEQALPWPNPSRACAELARLREEGPVQQLQLPAGPRVWLVTRYEEARRALADPRLAKDPRRLPDPQRQGFGGRRCPDDVWAVVGRHSANSDGADHQRYQAAYGPFFHARSMDRWHGLIEEFTTTQLTDLAYAKSPDLLENFARPVPARVVSRIVGLGDEHAATVARCARQWVSGQHPARIAPVIKELQQVIFEAIRLRRARPGEDLLSAMLARQAAGEWSLHEVMGIAFGTLVAGCTNTPTLVVAAAAAAAGDQKVRESLTDPEATERLIEEVLRHQPPAGNSTWRFALQDIVLGGVAIPQGAVVVVSLNAANRDPRAYPQPADLCPQRARRPAHLSFGHGPHFCSGAPLARLEAMVMLPALFAEFPRLTLTLPLEETAWQMGMVEQQPITVPVALGEGATR